MKPTAGNTLIEYVVIGSCVVMVCVAAVIGVSQDFNALLAGLKGDMQGNIARAKADVTQLTTGKAPTATGGSPYSGRPVNGQAIIPPPAAGEVQACFEGGFCLNVPAFSPSGALVQTSGGNGTEMINAYISVLEQIVAQLEADPAADPTLTQMITNLANEGHGIAATEDMAVNVTTTGMLNLLDYAIPVDTGLNSPPSFASNGVALPGLPNADLVSQIGSEQARFNEMKTALESYLNANPGALPPELITTIDAGGDMVDNMADVSKNHLNTLGLSQHKFQNPNDGTYWTYLEGFGFYPADFTDVSAGKTPPPPLTPQLTEVASNGICGSGGKAPECMENLYEDPTIAKK